MFLFAEKSLSLNCIISLCCFISDKLKMSAFNFSDEKKIIFFQISLSENNMKAFENCNLKHFNVHTADKNLKFVIFNKY